MSVYNYYLYVITDVLLNPVVGTTMQSIQYVSIQVYE